MGQHARLAPSAAYRWTKCARAPDMEAQYPDTDNEYSLQGSAAHYVGERCLKNDEDPRDWVGRIVNVETADGGISGRTITEEDAQAVWVYVDYVRRRIQEIGHVVATHEHPVNPGAWLNRSDCEGTADTVLYGNTCLEVIDYKHGAGKVVEPENNEQELLYSMGACAEIDWYGVDAPDHGLPIMMTIVQPRAPHPDGAIRTWAIPARDLFARVNDFRSAAAATDDPNAPFTPGEEQCRWCKASADCPARAQAALEVFQPLAQEPAPVLAAINSMSRPSSQQAISSDWDSIESFLGRPANQLTLEEKVRALDNEGLVTSWFKAIRESLTEYALEGNPVPDHKLVQGKTNRKWGLDTEDMIAKLAKLRTRDTNKAIGKAQVIKTDVISVAQAEKKLRPLITERAWKLIAKHIVKPEGKPVLVPLSDPREAIKTAEEVFQPQEAAPAPWE